MTGLPASLRQIRALWVTLFAVLFLAGPVMDSIICAADDVPAAASIQTVDAVDNSHHTAQHGGSELPGMCQHGHAHAAPAFAGIAPMCSGPAVQRLATLSPMAIRLPPSTAGPSLDRPPRA